MKNSIIILLFLFAFTGNVNAQEAKSTVKKVACCTSDEKKACSKTKKACNTDSSNCCLISETEKAKCCANDKAKAVSSTNGKESCNTNSACCGDCKKSKTKA